MKAKKENIFEDIKNVESSTLDTPTKRFMAQHLLKRDIETGIENKQINKLINRAADVNLSQFIFGRTAIDKVPIDENRKIASKLYFASERLEMLKKSIPPTRVAMEEQQRRKSAELALDEILSYPKFEPILMDHLERQINHYWDFKKNQQNKVKTTSRAATTNKHKEIREEAKDKVLSLYDELSNFSDLNLSNKILAEYILKKSKFIICANNLLNNCLNYRTSTELILEAQEEGQEFNDSEIKRSQAYKDAMKHTTPRTSK